MGPQSGQRTERTPAVIRLLRQHCAPDQQRPVAVHELAPGRLCRQRDWVRHRPGGEELFDLVMHTYGRQPSGTVLIASVRSILWHAGKSASTCRSDGLFRSGSRISPDMRTRCESWSRSRFPSDAREQLELISDFCRQLGVECALSTSCDLRHVHPSQT